MGLKQDQEGFIRFIGRSTLLNFAGEGLLKNEKYTVYSINL